MGRKSTAPFFIASTAFSTVPNADITITGVSHVLRAHFFQQRQAVHARQLQIRQDQVDIAGVLEAFLRGAGGLHLIAVEERCRPITRRCFSSSSITRIDGFAI